MHHNNFAGTKVSNVDYYIIIYITSASSAQMRSVCVCVCGARESSAAGYYNNILRAYIMCIIHIIYVPTYMRERE